MQTIKGFTLIELTTTIIITGIVTCLILPKILEQKDFVESTLNKKIFNSLIFAQNMAMYSGCHVAVVNNIENLRLYLRDNCRSGSFNQNVADPNNSANIYQIVFPKNLSLHSNNFTIYFDHNGQARSVNTDAISDFSLNMEGGKFAYSININGFNGSIDAA